MNNQRGNTTLLMLMLVMALCLFCFFSIEYGKQQLISNLSRARTYRCMKDQLKIIHAYSENMRAINIAIKSAFAFSYIPAVKTIHQTLKYGQQVYHVSFVKNLSSTKSCHFTQSLSFLYKLPYQHRGLLFLLQGPDGSARATKEKTWSYLINNYAGRDGEKPSFVLKAEVSFKKENFVLSNTSEQAIVEWSRSQLSSYLPSLVRWLPAPFKSISKFLKNKNN